MAQLFSARMPHGEVGGSPDGTLLTTRGNPLTSGLSMFAAVAIAVAGAVVGWKSAGPLEMLWDEHVDRSIAVGLAHNPLFGERPAIDPSQTRLPMYVNAAVFAATGRNDVATSRMVSLVAGAVTVLVTAMLGRMLFGPLVGAMAALLLAMSPYFLSFARIAMTEGDVFFACFMMLAIWGIVRYRDWPTAGRWATAGILMALAVGAKVFAVVPLTVLLAEAALTAPRRMTMSGTAKAESRTVLVLLIVAATVAVGGLVAARISQLAGVIVWAGLAALWVYIVRFVTRRRAIPLSTAGAIGGLILLAAVSFCALMPVHLTSHEIAGAILGRLLRWDHETPLAHCADHLRLYSGIVLIKPGLPFGVITVASLIYAIARVHRAPAWRLCLLPTAAYTAAICFLPLRQTFYLMGVYPLIILMTAATIVSIGRWLRRRSRLGGTGWGLTIVLLLAHLGFSDYLAYPWFHLFGYELIGDRWMGAESRGYRNLIQTPSDGVESLIRWCNTDPRVRPGSRVVSFLWEDQPGQMVDDVLPAKPPYVFVRRGLTQESDAVPPAPSIEGADFVLLHINNLLGYGDRPPDHPPLEALSRRFEPVFTVKRGPLEVAWVYGRRK